MKFFRYAGIVSLALAVSAVGPLAKPASGQVCDPEWDAVSIAEVCHCYNGRFNYQITSFTELDGTLVAGGGFAGLTGSCPGMPPQCGPDPDPVAKWNGSAFVPFVADTDCHQLAGVVNAVAEFQDELYVGGSWSACACLAASAPGTADGGLGGCGCGGGCLNGLGHCEADGDGDCDSSCILGSIVRWNEAWGDWEAVGGDVSNGMGCGLEDNGLTAKVLSMFVWDDQRGGGEALYVGGYFTQTRGGLVGLNHIGKWDGTTWTPLGQGINISGCCSKHPPRAFASMHDCQTGLPLLYVAAKGTAINTDGSQVVLNGVGIWDGTQWSALPAIPGIGSTSALAVYDDGSGPAIYAGGSFENEQSGILNVAKWDGSQWRPLCGGVSVEGTIDNFAYVKALSVFDDGNGAALYVGGQFNEAGGNWWDEPNPGDCEAPGIDVNNIARWDGQNWSDVGGWMDGPEIIAMRRFDRAAVPELFVGGFFPNYGEWLVETGNVVVWSGCAGGDCPQLTITDSFPPDGAIDARQPHALSDASVRYGWDHVDITFDGDVSALGPEHFTVTVTSGAAPMVIDVIPIGCDQVRVVLDGPIPPGAWTTITYICTGQGICLGYLPADANNDAYAGPLDILKLIDNLNGVYNPPMAIWQCDTDRSNVCAPSDILRLIDLLNGAGAFDPWLGVSLPPSPCSGGIAACVQCQPPAVVGVGSRYLQVSLESGPYPVRLQVTCPDGALLYGGAPQGSRNVAFLVDDVSQAAMLTPAQWGATVYVTGVSMAPNSTYEVRLDFGVPVLSPPGIGTTWKWADLDHNGIVSFMDVSCGVQAFQGNYGMGNCGTFYAADLIGGAVSCLPNVIVNFGDVNAIIKAFQGVPYACPLSCGALGTVLLTGDGPDASARPAPSRSGGVPGK
ncbi:MAG: hypothetical protein HOP29_18680 [Phycisphaerales bacterium]|nr:hypothetical protein [Phycisphaerales bacterium]